MERVDEILKFWFGHVEETIVPSERRARIWFAEDEQIDIEMKANFMQDLQFANANTSADWETTPRGQLALILLLDQFARHIFRNSALAFASDDKALRICLTGMQKQFDHELSLIERVFYYFPLLHAESLQYQERAVRAYAILTELAFAETRVIYDSFLKFANHHYGIIQRFGRFPQRNKILERESTPEELAYLQELESSLSSTE